MGSTYLLLLLVFFVTRTILFVGYTLLEDDLNNRFAAHDLLKSNLLFSTATVSALL